MNKKQDMRKNLGYKFKALREEKGLSAYKVAQSGNIRIEQVKAVECGESNYTIDVFLGYLKGCEIEVDFLV